MSVTMDLIALSVIILSVILGVFSGLIKSAAKFLGAIFSVFLSSLFGGMLANWVYQTFFRPAFLERVESSIGGLTGAESINNMLKTLPDFILRALDQAGINANTISGDLAKSQGEMATAFVDSVSPLFVSFLKVFAVIVLFMLFMVVVRGVANILERIVRFPLLLGINRALGGVFGFFQAIILLWIIIAAVSVFMPMMSPEMQQSVDTTIRQTIIVRPIHSLNPFLSIFK